MNNAFNKTAHRVTHRISESPSPRSIPSTGVRKPNVNSPAPLGGGAAKKGRCASCGGGRHKF